MTWDEAVRQHTEMWQAKEANVPRGMISVCTYDDFPKPKNYSSSCPHEQKQIAKP
jgi:hypothetical protein